MAIFIEVEAQMVAIVVRLQGSSSSIGHQGINKYKVMNSTSFSINLSLLSFARHQMLDTICIILYLLRNTKYICAKTNIPGDSKDL